MNVFIFPLNAVLFPEGILPLKVFEQRYLELTKACLRDDKPFGVCRIREGQEVGTAAVPEPVGCLASIVQWDMPQLGLFHLVARGGQRFRVLETSVAANQLMSAEIEMLAPEPAGLEVDPLCGTILKAIIDKVGAEHFPQPLKLADAAWVSYRLSEVLPIDLAVKQELLQVEDTAARLQRLRAFLELQGLTTESKIRDA